MAFGVFMLWISLFHLSNLLHAERDKLWNLEWNLLFSVHWGLVQWKGVWTVSKRSQIWVMILVLLLLSRKIIQLSLEKFLYYFKKLSAFKSYCLHSLLIIIKWKMNGSKNQVQHLRNTTPFQHFKNCILRIKIKIATARKTTIKNSSYQECWKAKNIAHH